MSHLSPPLTPPAPELNAGDRLRSIDGLDSDCVKAAASGDAVASQRRHGRDDSSKTPYYEDSAVRIYHGDCMDILPALATDSVDVTITSPPYNLGEGMEDKGGYRVAHKGSLWSGSRLRNGYATHDDAMPYADYVAWQKAVLRECWRVTRGAIYYNHKPRIVKGLLRTPLELTDLPVRQIVIWDRGSGFNFMCGAYVPQHEWIVVMAKPGWTLREKAASGAGDVWRIPPDAGNEHPASFPVALPETVIETSGAKSVLDPFMGSGTSLLAAKERGVKAVGIELSERYCEMAAKRMSQEVLNFTSAAVQ